MNHSNENYHQRLACSKCENNHLILAAPFAATPVVDSYSTDKENLEKDQLLDKVKYFIVLLD